MTRPQKLAKDFLDRLKAVKAKRPKTVIDHILKHGFITTEELSRYGYEHPPRAARDVRELGIPLETFQVKNAQGRTIAAYRFGDPSQARMDQLGGRKAIPKEFKRVLLGMTKGRCQICDEQYETRHLQVDHRVPYEVVGDVIRDVERNPNDYMLLCGSCNRAKSWSCEHCLNWLKDKRPGVCETCYWARPESYLHIALMAVRRLDIVWKGDEVKAYEKLMVRARRVQQPLPKYVKRVLEKTVEQDKSHDSNSHSK